MERLAAHERRRLVRDTDRQKHLAVNRAFAHGVVAIVGAVKIILGVDMQAMRAAEQALSPALDEITRAIEHDHWVGATVENIDTVLAVDRNRGDVGELPTLRQLRPILCHSVTMLARAEDSRHDSLPRLVSRLVSNNLIPAACFHVISADPSARRVMSPG